MIKSVFAALALSAMTVTGAGATVFDGHMEQAAKPTIASPIKDLLANPETAAVMEKHLPGIAQHPMRSQFEDMTLAEVMPISQGAITQATIDAIDTDLKALPAT